MQYQHGLEGETTANPNTFTNKATCGVPQTAWLCVAGLVKAAARRRPPVAQENHYTLRLVHLITLVQF